MEDLARRQLIEKPRPVRFVYWKAFIIFPIHLQIVTLFLTYVGGKD